MRPPRTTPPGGSGVPGAPDRDPALALGGDGAPLDPEAADPAFDRIPAPRFARSPFAAGAILALCAVLAVFLADDARYALSAGAPIDLGPARRVPSSSLVDNRYVRVEGPADYRNALLFEPKGDDFRRSFFRLLGTGSRLFVAADETKTRAALSDVYEGRLRRFDALPWAGQVRDWFGTKVTVTRSLDLTELKARLGAGPGALGNGPLTLRDRAGEALTVSGADRVAVVLDFPEELLVRLSREKFAVAEDAAHELARLGAPIGPPRETRTDYIFPVRVPVAERNAFLARLEPLRYGFSLRRERFELPLPSLRLVDAGLGFPAGPTDADTPDLYLVDGGKLVPAPRRGPAGAAIAAVPWDHLVAVEHAEAVVVPPDAWIVVENQRPQDFRWVLYLDGLLALLAALNLWWLTRSLGSRKTAA